MNQERTITILVSKIKRMKAKSEDREYSKEERQRALRNMHVCRGILEALDPENKVLKK